MYARIEKEFIGKYEEAFKETDKLKRGELVGKASEEVKATIDPENELEMRYVGDAIEKLMHKVVREKVLTTGHRIDGRDTKTVRPIQCEVDVLPCAHGSALFTRGETQAMVVTTLGTGEDAQIVDGLMNEYKEDFMLNYNFPPFSVGECGRMGSRDAAKSVTASWHGVPFIRCCRKTRILSPIPSVSFRKLWNRTVLLRWQRYAVQPCL